MINIGGMLIICLCLNVVRSKNSKSQQKVGIWNFKDCMLKGVYFPLFASLMYFSKAIVIEGVSGVGARISILKP
ncbi:hypothetical protein D3C80_1837440 [compost metagenome]